MLSTRSIFHMVDEFRGNKLEVQFMRWASFQNGSLFRGARREESSSSSINALQDTYYYWKSHSLDSRSCRSMWKPRIWGAIILFISLSDNFKVKHTEKFANEQPSNISYMCEYARTLDLAEQWSKGKICLLIMAIIIRVLNIKRGTAKEKGKKARRKLEKADKES